MKNLREKRWEFKEEPKKKSNNKKSTKSKSPKSTKLITPKEIKPKELVEKSKIVSPPPRTRASTRISKKQKVDSPIIEKIEYKQVPIEEAEEDEEEEEERLTSSPCSSPSASPEPASDEIETVYHVQTINGKISLNNNTDFLIADYTHFSQPFENVTFDERFTYHVNDQLLRQLTEPLSTSMLSFPEPSFSGVDMLFKDATLSSLYYEESFSHPHSTYSDPYSLRKNDEELQRERENYLIGWINTSWTLTIFFKKDDFFFYINYICSYVIVIVIVIKEGRWEEKKEKKRKKSKKRRKNQKKKVKKQKKKKKEKSSKIKILDKSCNIGVSLLLIFKRVFIMLKLV
jgi:hypothetical protein